MSSYGDIQSLFSGIVNTKVNYGSNLSTGRIALSNNRVDSLSLH